MFNKIIKKIYGSGIGNYPFFKQLYFLHDWFIKKINKGYKIYNIDIKGIKAKIKANIETSYLAKSIKISGYYEKNISDYFIDNIKDGDSFLDIGANLGYYSLIASKKVGETGKVFSFEPVKENFELLQENIKLNNLNNIESLNYGLGNENKDFEISINPNNIGNDSIVLNHNSGQKENISIKRFDDLNLDIDKSKIKFIKIDIEGYEFEAIKGMENLIDSNDNIKIIMEFSPQFYLNFGENYTDEFIRFIYDKGFKTYSFDSNLKEIDLNNYKDVKQLDILLSK